MASCPTWGRSAGEDEISLLVGPAAVLGTVLAAIAQAIRPAGMSIGLKGRRVALAGATCIAVVTIICTFVAMYLNEACVESIVLARTGDAEVTLLQMFWMLTPGVGAASIISAVCTLAATRFSLPRWKSGKWAVDHIPKVVQNGVISPRDDYGIGVGALRRYSDLWWIAYGTWALVTIIMVYTTARGDLTNGLLNLAGMLAVATNTGIPVWNESTLGSGVDSKSKNVDLIRTVETNVVGNFYDNAAAVTTAVRSSDTMPGPPVVLGRTQNYVVANAHTMLVNYRSEEMEAGRFAQFGKDPVDLGRAIIDATLATTKLLSRLLAEADYGDEETERMTISAYMCTIAVHSAWADVQAQRRRLLAVALAIAWSMKITGSLGGRIARTDETLKAEHKAEMCSCCIHRWTVWRPLQETVNAEMHSLFGTSGNLPQIQDRPDKQAFAASVWEYLRANVGTTVRNRGLLLYYWIMAMMDNSMLQQQYDSLDFFPQAAVKLQAFSAEDFKHGCSSTTRGGTYTWKPSIVARDAHPMPRHQCTVDVREMSAINPQGRHRMYPHPKVLDHVARRTIYRGTIIQSVIWGLQGLRGLFSG